MDTDEKLIALKKAYADVILNISKEAAARVMSSERRAVRYQHELKVAKEEALLMALRLKQMMDSRNVEAEAVALNQQKKIEELEAQLHEAEDIVEDLREKLGKVQAEMGRIKEDNLQNVNEPKDTSSREMATSVHSYQSSKFLHPNPQDEFQIASDVRCCKCDHSKKVCMCGSYNRNRDLPSIILRNKESGLCRNGCTQIILAYERNLLENELCVSGKAEKLMDENDSNEPEDEDISKAPSSGDKTPSEVKNKLLTDTKLSTVPPFHGKRKRATRRRKTVTALSRKQTDSFLEPCRLSETSANHIPVSAKENAHSCENPSKLAPMLSPSKAETRVESSDGRVLPNDEGLKENGFTESSQPPVCKVDVEKADILSNSLETNSSGLPSQPVRERVIKYTFQRKRKRGVLSESEVNPVLETEKTTGNQENGHKKVEPSKSSLLVESSRDSRRLAQVARQLISLSGRRSWH